MSFISIEFLVFLPIVFALYWSLADRSLRWQNLLVVVASYVFYGWWDWRFLSLIFISTIIDYSVGRFLAKEQQAGKRKLLLWVSILMNLGLLGFFKYCNFFIDSFVSAFSTLGFQVNPVSLNIILPVGISFYTFQTMSYTIDVYRRKLEPTKDLVAFAAFVSFFPQLVAGPIERATNLLPQFYVNRRFDYAGAVDGMRQILWGFFKKIVIADNCALHANDIFNNYSEYSGSTLILGVIYFAFQIYGDFSGYSDIAIGTSRLFGIDLMQNFACPYFSRDIAEFWRRWHISLSTWFRDYVYIPLGGSRCSLAKKVRNTFIVFIVSGLWHGANWTFIIWGGLHALFFLPLLLFGKNRVNVDIVSSARMVPTGKEFLQMFITFALVSFAWVFFRAENMSHAFDFLAGICNETLFASTNFTSKNVARGTNFAIIFLLFMEWCGRKEKYAIARLGLNWHWCCRWSFYSFLVFLMFMLMETDSSPFIYFQF
ncbi:MAG: MBOAT family protein [Sedimentisphaerales bacterium]|nr:MBOAT family protein [Sedimentisphaerales bacterium]